jgi:hypothetical protein
LVGGTVFANARGLSIPGTCVTIGEPGLKPSSRFQSVVSMGVPAWFRGVDGGLTFRRSPVAVEGSPRVKKSFGQGSRQSEGSIGSQPAAGAAGVAATANDEHAMQPTTESTQTAPTTRGIGRERPRPDTAKPNLLILANLYPSRAKTYPGRAPSS